MNSEQFCFWLQGFFEMTDSKNLSEAQVKMIKEHLGLVFQKVTPPLQKKGLLTDSPVKGIIGAIKPLTETEIKEMIEKSKKEWEKIGKGARAWLAKSRFSGGHRYC